MNIADYIKYYLGCKVACKKKDDSNWHIGDLCEVTKGSNHGEWGKAIFHTVIEVIYYNYEPRKSNFHTFFFHEDEIKPILRPVAEMTDQQNAEYAALSLEKCHNTEHLIGDQIDGILVDLIRIHPIYIKPLAQLCRLIEEDCSFQEKFREFVNNQLITYLKTKTNAQVHGHK